MALPVLSATHQVPYLRLLPLSVATPTTLVNPVSYGKAKLIERKVGNKSFTCSIYFDKIEKSKPPAKLEN